jgi:hypothetical protein
MIPRRQTFPIIWCQSTCVSPFDLTRRAFHERQFMGIDILILEVDGSLANPYAAGAVAVWSAVLCGIAIMLVRRVARPGRNRAAWALLFVVALVATRPAQLLIGSALYRIADPRITGVGFWGGPPVWIAPIVSCSVGVLAWIAAWYRNDTRTRSRPVLVGLIAAPITVLLVTGVSIRDDWHNSVEADRFASIHGAIEKGMSEAAVRERAGAPSRIVDPGQPESSCAGRTLLYESHHAVAGGWRTAHAATLSVCLDPTGHVINVTRILY